MGRHSSQAVKRRSKKRKYLKKKKFASIKSSKSDQRGKQSEITNKQPSTPDSVVGSEQKTKVGLSANPIDDLPSTYSDLSASGSLSSTGYNESSGHSEVGTSSVYDTRGSDIENKLSSKNKRKIPAYEAKKKLLNKMLNPEQDPYYNIDPLAANFSKWRTLKTRQALLELAISRLEKSPI